MKTELTRYERRILKFSRGIHRSVSLSLSLFIVAVLLSIVQALEIRGFNQTHLNGTLVAALLFCFSYSYHYAQAQHVKRLQSEM